MSVAAPRGIPRQRFGMAGTMGFRQIEPHAIGHQHIEHAPQQMARVFVRRQD